MAVVRWRQVGLDQQPSRFPPSSALAMQALGSLTGTAQSRNWAFDSLSWWIEQQLTPPSPIDRPVELSCRLAVATTITHELICSCPSTALPKSSLDLKKHSCLYWQNRLYCGREGKFNWRRNIAASRNAVTILAMVALCGHQESSCSHKKQWDPSKGSNFSLEFHHGHLAG